MDRDVAEWDTQDTLGCCSTIWWPVLSVSETPLLGGTELVLRGLKVPFSVCWNWSWSPARNEQAQEIITVLACPGRTDYSDPGQG